MCKKWDIFDLKKLRLLNYDDFQIMKLCTGLILSQCMPLLKFLVTHIASQGRRIRSGRGDCSPPIFGRWINPSTLQRFMINPIQFKWGTLCPPHSNVPTNIFKIPAGLPYAHQAQADVCSSIYLNACKPCYYLLNALLPAVNWKECLLLTKSKKKWQKSESHAIGEIQLLLSEWSKIWTNS